MIYIYILNILIIIVVIILLYSKNKKDKINIIRFLTIIFLIIAFTPYNLILKFKTINSAFKFFNYNKQIIDILDKENDSIVLYKRNKNNFAYDQFYKINNKWKQNSLREEKQIIKEIDDIEYIIKIIKLNTNNSVVIISSNKTEELNKICDNNLKNYKTKSINICYGILNKEYSLNLKNEIIEF